MQWRLTESKHKLYSPLYAEEIQPLEAACLSLAEMAHEKDAEGNYQVRKKPIYHSYITHPVLAYRVLKAVGVNDWITTGSVFVHDCLEQGVIDGKSFDTSTNIAKNNIDHLKERIEGIFVRLVKSFIPNDLLPFTRQRKFIDAFTKEFAPEEKLSLADKLDEQCWLSMSGLNISEDKKRKVIAVFTGLVESTVAEVSNSQDVESKVTNKRFEQIQKSERLSNRAKIVKMADFAASLIDDMIVPRSDDARKKRIAFIHRAWDVTKKCQDANPLLGKLIEVLVEKNLEQLRLQASQDPRDQEEATKMGDSFDLVATVEEAKAQLRQTASAEVLEDTEWLNNPIDGALKRGVEGVKLVQGGIRNFRVIIDPAAQNDHPANKAAWSMADDIEQDNSTTVYTGNISITPHYNIIVKMRTDQPLPVNDFLKFAKKNNAIDDVFTQMVLKHRLAQPINAITQARREANVAAIHPIGWSHPAWGD